MDVLRVKLDDKNSTGLLFKEGSVHGGPNVYYYRKESAASYFNIDDIDLG